MNPDLALEMPGSANLQNLSGTTKRGRGKSKSSLALVEAAVTILREIQPASVRAVCYRLFTLGLIADMGKASTGAVSKHLVWAREQGMVDWQWIVE